MKTSLPHLNLLTIAILSTSLLNSNFASAQADNSDRKNLETITVIGEKTERTLKDTASSVSVITSEVLESGQYLSIANALSDIANVVTLSGAQPDIRGVSGNGSATGFHSFAGGSKARVSTLIDGVAEPFIADLSGDTGLWDIEQVEVFRGPQSTSNGRNSFAGAVIIKTKDPLFDWQGSARLGYRNQENYLDTALAITGPLLEDELAVRISAQHVDGQGINKGDVYETNPVVPFDLNKLETSRVRAKLLWKPADIDALNVMLSHSINKEKGDSGRNYYLADEPWDLRPSFQRNMDTSSNTTSVNVDYQLSDSQSIDILVSYMTYKWGFTEYAPLVVDQSDVLMEDDSYTIDGKFNMGLDTDKFSAFIGLSHYKRSQDFRSIGAFAYNGDDSSKSSAIYGELEYALNKQWHIIAGARLEKETQTRNFNANFRGKPLAELLDNDKTIALPKLVIQYAITNNTTLSASARRGYNAGGGTISFATNEYYYYGQETVNTYEISSRSSFNDGDINISANLFFNNFNDYQGSDSSRKITNIDDATSQGLEIELDAMLTQDWQLTAGLGLLSTKVKAANTEFGDIIGNELSSAPQYTASIGTKYWLSDKFTMSAFASYVDEYFGDMNNTTERIAGGYTTARINLDYQIDEWRVSAFVNNTFDKKAFTVAEPPGRTIPEGYVAVVEPRNVGVNVTYSF